MQEIMRLAHEFLQNFCAGNQQNQALLHKHTTLFLNPGVRGRRAARGGAQLCLPALAAGAHSGETFGSTLTGT